MSAEGTFISILRELASDPIITTGATVVGALATIGVPAAIYSLDLLRKRRELRDLKTFRNSSSTSGPVKVPQERGILDMPVRDRHLDKVRFGVIPYIDHTYAFIAQHLGWFAEIGIEVTFKAYTPETILPALEEGEVDVVSATTSAAIERGVNPHKVKAFCLCDVFQGYALMGSRPNHLNPFSRFCSYEDLRKKGLDHSDSVRRIAQQIKGKRIAYSNDNALYPFLDQVLKYGELNRVDHLKRVQAEERRTVDALVGRKANLQVGGVPSRLLLERLGYRPLITSKDLISNGVVFSNCADYLGIVQSCWLAKEEDIIRNYDLILRLAGLSFRVIGLINRNPEYAALIQAPYLNQIAETEISDVEIEKAYKHYHPFYTYEQQQSWFFNPSDQFFAETVASQIIDYWRRKKPDTFEISDHKEVIIADQIYRDLQTYKVKCQSYTQKALEEEWEMPQEARAIWRAAKDCYNNYDFVDACVLFEQVERYRL